MNSTHDQLIQFRYLFGFTLVISVLVFLQYPQQNGSTSSSPLNLIAETILTNLETDCTIHNYKTCVVEENLHRYKMDQENIHKLKKIFAKFTLHNHNTGFDSKANVRLISTWNVWGPPWESHKVFSRLQRWRTFNDDQIVSLLNFYFDNINQNKNQSHAITNHNNYQLRNDIWPPNATVNNPGQNQIECKSNLKNNSTNSCNNNNNNNTGIQLKKAQTQDASLNDTNSNVSNMDNIKVPLIISCFQEAFSFVQGPGINKCKNDKQEYSHFYERTLFVGSIVKSILFNNKGNGNAVKKECVTRMNDNEIGQSSESRKYFSQPWDIANILKQDEQTSIKAQIHAIPSIPAPSSGIWDTQRQIFESNGKIPYIYVIGTNGLSLHQNRLSIVDSGLSMMSTWIPTEYDFRGYKNYPTVKMTGIKKLDAEVFANKGVLWAYFKSSNKNNDNSVGTIVLTTHLSAKGQVKKLQLGELKDLIDELKAKFIKQTKYFEMYLVGDFNLLLREQALKDFIEQTGFQSLTNGKATEANLRRAIDHIFLWRNDDNQSDTFKMGVINHDPILPWHYADQNNSNVNPNSQTQTKTKTKFRKQRGDLSDHCWQGVILS